MATTKVQPNHLKESTNTGIGNFETDLDSSLSRQIKALDSKLDSKIKTLDSKFDSKFRTLDSKFDLKISGLDSKIKADLKADFGAEVERWVGLLGPGVVFALVGYVSVVLIFTMSYLLTIYRF
jgi:hypothetical protein